MIEIENDVYAALQTLGKDLVMELAQGLVRARMLHPVFAESAAEGAAVVYTEASELVASVHDRESVARQRAEAIDTAVTAIRYMGKFGVTSPVGASEGVNVAYDSDDDFEGVSGAPTTLFEMMEQTAQEAQRKEYYNCPSCGYELDTGWECNRCGADWEKEATGKAVGGHEPRGAVLNEAINIINGERQDVYGSPEDSFALISDYWTTYVRSRSPEVANAGFCLFADDVAIMMTLFKIAREANQHKRDNIVDAAGYLGIYADMQEG